MGKGGIDDIQLAALAQKGFKFRAVPYAEGARAQGRRCSAVTPTRSTSSPATSRTTSTTGQFKPVLHFNNKRQEGLKGNYTLSSELGINDVIDQFRGLVASADMPEAQLKTMSEACSKVETDPKFADFQKDNLEFKGAFMDSAAFGLFIKKEEAKMKKLGTQYGVFGQ